MNTKPVVNLNPCIDRQLDRGQVLPDGVIKLGHSRQSHIDALVMQSAMPEQVVKLLNDLKANAEQYVDCIHGNSLDKGITFEALTV
jgi:hypothetical protein